jgi:amidohydrolase
MLDRTVWQEAPGLVTRLVQQIVAPFGGVATVSYERGVPPVVNDPSATALLTAAVTTSLGAAAAVPTQQSLGGEDFGWYLEKVPGAMARLGVRAPSSDVALDLHQPAFDVDESCIGIGVRVLVTAALAALDAT